jgi:uncharacterized protein (DUF1015 family)
MTGIAAGLGLLMAPFRGLRYADAATLSRRLAPPYDVITPEARRALEKLDHANVVNLDLPVAPPGGDPYREAGQLLKAWQSSGILVREKEPAAYVLRSTSTFEDGVMRSRTGVFLAMACMPFAPGGRVRPHEKTHAGPKEDRRQLMHATGANTSSIFLLSPDSGGRLVKELGEVTKDEPWASCEAIGAKQEVWVATGARALRLATIAGDEPVYIADGHHRYETAVAFKDEAPRQWKIGAERTLAHVVSFKDPGLEILPTHRLIEGSALERQHVLRWANPYFARAVEGQRPHFSAVFADGTEAAMVLREEADLSAATELPQHPSARELPVAVADNVFIDVVLRTALGKAPKFGYTASAQEARDAVNGGKCALAVLLPPTRLEEVKAVSDAGQVMPQKSTYFAPKVPTGVVLRLFEGEI